MFKNTKQPVLPQEGDLLFERKPLYDIGFLWIAILLIATNPVIIVFDVFTGEVSTYDTLYIISLIVGSIMGLLSWYMIIELIYSGLKNGFNDETYKAYYFNDKIIFYRISKYADEIYTQGLSKEQIENKIKETRVEIESMEKLLAETENGFSIDISMKKYHLKKLEIGLNLIEVGLGKPHKFEVMFSDIKYFINENNQIKLVEKTDDDENKLNSFYNKLTLSKKYIKHQSAVVEFLNQRIAESVILEIEENIN